MKKIVYIVSIFVLLISVLFLLTGCSIKDLKYETSRDEIIKSPNGEYTIILRYDYVSRPYIFKDNKLVFETHESGYNETVYFKVKWVSENKIMLYNDSGKEKYKNDKYYITIN
ncbi:MAG: hypothetical protein J6O56_00170 [Bacilli bacterium]|nr:hypothetical protein [Bacilli bacterium]